MSYYPPDHHPVFFLINALRELGADAEFVKDARTLDCWGLSVNGKLVVYLIDNRHPHERIKEDPAAVELLKQGVLVCSAQKPDAERIGAKWLPLAVTPGYRPPNAPAEKLYDVAFVGYVRDAGREQVLRHVARHFKLFVGQGLFGDDAVSAYWSARVGLNVPTGYGSPTAYDSANMRCFEILATGTILVTPHEDYLGELGLAYGKTCFTYGHSDSLIEVIKRGMENWYFNKDITEAGAQLATERHTYAHRAKTVLEWLA